MAAAVPEPHATHRAHGSEFRAFVLPPEQCTTLLVAALKEEAYLGCPPAARIVRVAFASVGVSDRGGEPRQARVCETLQAQARLKGGERLRTARPRAVPTGNTNDKAVSRISSASDLSASSCVGTSTIAVVSSMAGSTSMAVDGARAAMAGCIAPTRMAAWKPATAGMLAATTSSASRSSMARMLGLGLLGEGR